MYPASLVVSERTTIEIFFFLKVVIQKIIEAEPYMYTTIIVPNDRLKLQWSWPSRTHDASIENCGK